MNLESREFKFFWNELLWKYIDPPMYNALMRSSKYFYRMYVEKPFYTRLKNAGVPQRTWKQEIMYQVYLGMRESAYSDCRCDTEDCCDCKCNQLCDIVIEAHVLNVRRWETFWESSACSKCYYVGRVVRKQDIANWINFVEAFERRGIDEVEISHTLIRYAKHFNAVAFMYWYFHCYRCNAFPLLPVDLTWCDYVEYVLQNHNDPSIENDVLRTAISNNSTDLYDMCVKYIPIEKRKDIVQNYRNSPFWNSDCTIAEILNIEYQDSNQSMVTHILQCFNLGLVYGIRLTWQRYWG